MDVEAIFDLLHLGSDTGKDTVTRMLEEDEDSFLYLADIATDGQYWRGPYSKCEYPVCAIHLLARIGDRRSLLAINSALVEYCDEGMDAWLATDLPHVLAHAGPAAVTMLTLAMREQSVDMFVRTCMLRALVMIAGEHRDAGPGIVRSIMDTVREEPDIDARTLFVRYLVGLKDPGMYRHMRDWLQEGFITDEFFGLRELDDKFEEWMRLSDTVPRDPLVIFTYHPRHGEMITRHGAWRESEAEDLPDLPPAAAPEGDGGRGGPAPGGGPDAGPPGTKRVKAGRNEPCPCGSGKKYKKCCMRMA